MRMHAVDSTSIDAVGYDSKAKELRVRFRDSGDVYTYYGVEPETYAAFEASESKGAYLNRMIKGRYFYKKAA